METTRTDLYSKRAVSHHHHRAASIAHVHHHFILIHHHHATASHHVARGQANDEKKNSPNKARHGQSISKINESLFLVVVGSFALRRTRAFVFSTLLGSLL